MASNLIASAKLGALTSMNVLQIVNDARGPGIRAFSYVGRCEVRGYRIEIAPRLPCDYGPMFAELDESASKAVIDVLALLAGGSSVPSLIDPLVNSAEEYFRIGRLARYIGVDEVSRFPRGRILWAETLRLRARGRNNVVAVRRRVLASPTLAQAALREALRIAEEELTLDAVDGHRATLASIRSLIRLIPPTTPVSRNILVNAANDAQRAAAPHVSELFRLVALILLGGINPLCKIPIIRLEKAMFFDMAAVVENAVRKIISRILPHHRVLDGNVERQPFLERPSRLGEPDIVLCDGDQLVALIDVKDKIVSTPSRSDIYQLFSHCVGAGCKVGVLVFIDANYEAPKSIGVWGDSVTLLQAAIRPSDAEEDLRAIAKHLGFL